MKVLRKIICVCAVVSLVLLAMSAVVYAVEYNDAKVARETFLRLHIRANSDSEEDQALKLEVRDALLTVTTTLLDGVKDRDSAEEIINDNLGLLTQTAQNVIAEEGYEYDVNIYIDNEFFDYREYDGFYLPEGYYDALIVEIGSGEGHNWWCVVFPAVCTSGAVAEPETKIPSQSPKDEDEADISEDESKSDIAKEEEKTTADKQEADDISEDDVKVNLQLVPDRFRISSRPTPSNDEVEIRYESWIYKTIRRIFNI